MLRHLNAFASALALFVLLLTPALALADKPPKQGATGMITKIAKTDDGKDYFEWECEAKTWKCYPPDGKTTIKGLEGKKKGDMVKIYYTKHLRDLDLQVEEVKPAN